MLLSTHSQKFLLQASFFVTAILFLFGLYDNYEFLLRFPFYIQASVELLGAVFFCVSALLFNSMPARIMLPTVGFLWAYVIISNLLSLYFFVSTIGLSEATATYTSTTTFMLHHILILALAPGILFVGLWWLLYRFKRHGI